MKERPILFSGAMIRAILEGRKTQTRRVVKLPNWATRDGLAFGNFDEPYSPAPGYGPEFVTGDWGPCPRAFGCPYGVPGDRLWMRESCWAYSGLKPVPSGFVAPANPDMQHFYCYDDHAERQAMFDAGIIFRVPSIHMPRWASRITLEITDVRVQRLQEISNADAGAEGIPQSSGEATALGLFDNSVTPGHEWDNRTSAENFRNLWDSINGKKHPWSENPWVWALTFRKMGDSK